MIDYLISVPSVVIIGLASILVYLLVFSILEYHKYGDLDIFSRSVNPYSFAFFLLNIVVVAIILAFFFDFSTK